MATDQDNKNSHVYRFGIPHEKDLKTLANDKYQFLGGVFTTAMFKISENLMDIAAIPLNLSQGKISFFCLTSDRKLKYFVAPSVVSKMNTSEKLAKNDAVMITQPVSVVGVSIN